MLRFSSCDLIVADRLRQAAENNQLIDLCGGSFALVDIEWKTGTQTGFEMKANLQQVFTTSFEQHRKDPPTMNRSTTVFLVNTAVMAFRAVYEDGGKVETFKTFDRTISKDDIVVVVSGTRHGFTTVKVKDVDVGVDIEDNNIDIKWAVCKVDLADHKRILGEEEDAISAVKAAEFNKKRRELMANVASPDDIAAIKALPIYKNGTPAETPKPAA